MVSIVGKKALVFAGAPSIAEVCAARLREHDAQVFLVHRRDLAAGDREAAWESLFQRVHTELGELDIFVCCLDSPTGSPICDTDLANFRDALYDTALDGWLGQKHAILNMRGGSGGCILHVISVLARAPAEKAAGSCAGLAGVLMSSKAAALECAKNEDDIVVNTVLVGPLPEQDDLVERLGGVVPISIDGVADTVLYLASDGAAYMTGTELAVDGGFLCQ